MKRINKFRIVLSFFIFLIYVCLKLFSYSNLIVYPKKPNSSDIPPHWNVTARTPDDYGLKYETILMRTSDGFTLKGWFIPGKFKKAVILVHGFEANKIKMLRYCQFLSDAGFGILLFDLRYFGESQGKFCSMGFYEKNDIKAAVKFLKEDKGINDIGILAESMGAAAAALCLKDEKLAKCVVMDSPFSNLKELLVYRGEKDKGLSRWLVELIVFITEKRLHYSMNWLSFEDEIKKINTPIFVICGQKDQKVPFEQCERMYNNANNSNVFWKVDCGHTEGIKVYPQEYQYKVLGFFRRYL